MTILKVSSSSRTTSVAGAIAGMMRDNQKVELLSIGAGAAHIAVKAIAMARRYLIGDNIAIACVPEFETIAFDDNKERTAIKFIVFDQKEYEEPVIT